MVSQEQWADERTALRALHEVSEDAVLAMQDLLDLAAKFAPRGEDATIDDPRWVVGRDAMLRLRSVTTDVNSQFRLWRDRAV